jgi:signal transduction histidine kinase
MLFAAKLDKSYAINKQHFDAKAAIEKIMMTYSFHYPDASVQLHAEEKEIIVSADKEGFNSMIGNLIENAFKYSPKNERIIDIDIKRNQNSTLISVKDQGIGIEDVYKKEVTNQFYRIGNENTRNTKGTGLGLYIVDKLVKNHNGELIISDNLPKGTIFTIKLPD